MMLRMLGLSLIGGLLFTGCGGDAPAPNRGDAAPSFALESVGGRRVEFPSQSNPSPTVIRFWADWCAYCYQEMKDIEPVTARLKAERLVVLAVNVGQGRPAVEAFAGRLGITYPVLVDEAAVAAKAYGVKALPTTFFVGTDGRIRNKLVGEADTATFERLARELLAAQPGRPVP